MQKGMGTNMKIFGKTDIGMHRSANQDRFLIANEAAEFTLCAVFDGMGGAAGGEEASNIAANAFLENAERMYLEAKGEGELTGNTYLRILKASAENANTAIYDAAKENNSLSGMGTTVVAALFTEEFVYALNVGDSRLYTVSDGVIRQVTKDHSYVQYLIDEGRISEADAQHHPNKNIITRCLGTEQFVEYDTFTLDREKGFVLLCSDGLTNFVTDEELFAIVSGEGSLEEKAEKLINTANEKGGMDNITAVIAEM